MKKILFVVALALLAVATFPAAAEETAESASAPATDPAGVVLETLFQDGATDAVEGSCTDQAIEVQIIPPPGLCPYGAPRCRVDDDCDAYCGDPRFGYCFSNNCCGCSG